MRAGQLGGQLTQMRYLILPRGALGRLNRKREAASQLAEHLVVGNGDDVMG